MAGNEWIFLSRQRADLEDLGCPRAPQARFARGNLQTRVARKSVIVEVFWVTLGSPRVAPELSWALLLQFCLAPGSDFRDRKFSQI